MRATYQYSSTLCKLGDFKTFLLCFKSLAIIQAIKAIKLLQILKDAKLVKNFDWFAFIILESNVLTTQMPAGVIMDGQ